MRFVNPVDYLYPPARERMQLRENPPASRMRWIIKQYAQKPLVVLGTLEAAFHLTGVDERVPYNVWPRMHAADAYTHLMEYAEEALNKLPAYSRYDFVLPWMAAQLNKVTPINADPLISRFVRQGTAIAQWALANRVDLGRVSWEEAIRQAEEFRITGPAEPGEVIYRFEDGWTLQKLTTASQLSQEGEIMQQCVGTYCAKVRAGESVIYSLRDAGGHPHVTMEWSPHTRRFTQIRGKQNQRVVEKYQERVWEVLLKKFNGETVGLLLTGFDFKAHNMRIDLHDADLAHEELGNTDLTGADLRRANLEDAWLVRSNLSFANFEGANLSGANLKDANAQNANFVDADMRGAELAFADLRGSDFTHADIRGASLFGARIDPNTKLYCAYGDEQTIRPIMPLVYQPGEI